MLKDVLMAKGKFVVIEGIDRSGKTTLSANLAKEMQRRGNEVYLTHEPTSFFDKGLDVLDRLKKDDYMILLAMFIRDRLEHNKIIMENLESGKIIICDRYSLSSFAYQGVFIRDLFNDNASFFNWMETVLSISHYKPDVTVFIDYDGKYYRQGNDEKRELEIFEDQEYLGGVYDLYNMAISKKIFFDPGIVVDGNASKEKMLLDTISKLEKYL